MGNHDRWLSWRWAWAFLVTASVVSALSLSDFQIIVPDTVPPGCSLAYNTRIRGCLLRDFDFKKENSCSAKCVRGLNRVQYIVQVACSGVDVGPNPLLGQVLMGNLVGLLCPGACPPDATTSSPSTRPTTEPTVATAITRASSNSALTWPTVRSSSTTSTIKTQTEDADVFSSISPTPVPATPIPTVAQPPTSTMTTKSPTSSSPPPPSPNGGGVGNPFEIVFNHSRRLLASWIKTMFVALGIGLLLLR